MITIKNKELEALSFEVINGGFKLIFNDAKYDIIYKTADNIEFAEPNIKIIAKKIPFKGYKLRLYLSYLDRSNENAFPRIKDIVHTLNPKICVKLKSDVNEYIEWIADSIYDAFNGII